jgi:hypothetical protein
MKLKSSLVPNGLMSVITSETSCGLLLPIAAQRVGKLPLLLQYLLCMCKSRSGVRQTKGGGGGFTISYTHISANEGDEAAFLTEKDPIEDACYYSRSIIMNIL